MKIKLIFFCLFFKSLLTFGQSVSLSGTITDQNNKPIPFATVYVQNSTRGTSANSDGKYQLAVNMGENVIVVRAIGYQQQSRRLNISENQTLDFKLPAESYTLHDVVIKAGGEDPAYAIMRKVIKKRNFYLTQVKVYSCEVYIKGLQKLLAAPKKFFGRDMNQIGREIGLDSNRRGIIYLSESVSKLTARQPDQLHEEMISSKVAGSNRAFSFNRASDLKVNFYDNLQNWEGLSNRPLVSPIADNAMFYYRYKFIGSVTENGETIDKIKVTARRSYDPVFEGYLYINENGWRLYGIDLEITKRANINFVDTLKINTQYFPVKAGVWMPSNVRFEFTGGIFGFRFGGYFISVYKNYKLDPVLDKKEFNEVLKITPGVNKKDSAYWAQARPVPLTVEETTDYHKKEILAKKRESKPYLDSLDKVRNKFKPAGLIFGTGYNHINRFDKEYYHFNSLLGSLLFNTVEGFAFDYNASFTKQIDSANNRYFYTQAKLRYGFSSQKMYGSLNGNVPLGHTNLGFNVGSDVLDMNSAQPFAKGDNSEYSLFGRQNYQKFYAKQFVGFSLSGRIAGGWKAGFGAGFSYRQWLSNTSNYSFYYTATREYTSNNPFDPNGTTPLFNNSRAFKISLNTSYDFSNLYQSLPTGRYYYPSKYPTINLHYTRGIKGLFASDVDYTLLTAGISKQDISMGFYGKTSFDIGAGKFLNANSLNFTDYKHFAGDQITLFQPGLTKFLLLPYYQYSTNNEYLEGHLEQNFSGFFTNKIPLVRKLKLQEIVDVNYLATPALKNYTELGFGLQYLVFRAMYGLSYQDGAKTGTGFRFGVLVR